MRQTGVVLAHPAGGKRLRVPVVFIVALHPVFPPSPGRRKPAIFVTKTERLGTTKDLLFIIMQVAKKSTAGFLRLQKRKRKEPLTYEIRRNDRSAGQSFARRHAQVPEIARRAAGGDRLRRHARHRPRGCRAVYGAPGAHRSIQETIAKYGIGVAALSCHGNPVHPNKEIARAYHEQFEAAICLAEKIGVDTVVGFSGCPGDCDSSQYPNWVVATWPDDFPEDQGMAVGTKSSSPTGRRRQNSPKRTT